MQFTVPHPESRVGLKTSLQPTCARVQDAVWAAEAESLGCLHETGRGEQWCIPGLPGGPACREEEHGVLLSMLLISFFTWNLGLG